MSNVVLLHNPMLEYRPDSSVPINIAAAAERIAQLLGGDLRPIENAGDSPYFVPFAAVHDPLALQKGINGHGDVYGGVVKELQHADKAVLHALASKSAVSPIWYSRTFAEKIAGSVLPGYTTFTREDTILAYKRMKADGLNARFKDPSNTGGLGQHLISHDNELHQLISQHGDKLSNDGIVIEADLKDHQTVTIGVTDLEGEKYSWYGRPYDVMHNDMVRFGGNELTVVRGEVSGLLAAASTVQDQLAIEQANQVFEAYDVLGTRISRATLDVVQGVGSDGRFLSGVTDPSIRPSASSAAEIRAIEAFHSQPDAWKVISRLEYDYSRDQPIEAGSSRELFLGHSRMNIFVELIEVV